MISQCKAMQCFFFSWYQSFNKHSLLQRNKEWASKGNNPVGKLISRGKDLALLLMEIM